MDHCQMGLIDGVFLAIFGGLCVIVGIVIHTFYVMFREMKKYDA